MSDAPTSSRLGPCPNIANCVDDLNRAAKDMDRAIRQETEPWPLHIHLRREAVRACRLLLLAREAGVDSLLGPLAPGPGRLIKIDKASDDRRLLWYWQMFATSWLRASAPYAFAADAGSFNFPAIKTKDGQVVAKDGKPLRTIETAEGGFGTEGEPARITDDYTEGQWMSHLRCQGKDWADACRAAARLLNDLNDQGGADDGPDGRPASRQTAPSKTSKIALALAVLTDHPDWTNEKIAEAAGCNVKYLSQAPKFKTARAAIRGLGQERQTRDRRSRGADMDRYAEGD